MNKAEVRWNEVAAEASCSEAEAVAKARFASLEAEDLTSLH